MESIFIHKDQMAVNCPAAGWTVLNSHGKLVPLNQLSIHDLAVLHSEFHELGAMPKDFFDDIQVTIESKSSVLEDQAKKKLIGEISKFISVNKKPTTPAMQVTETRSSVLLQISSEVNRSTLMKQILRGLSIDGLFGMKADLGYCTVVRKTVNWNRWYVITKDDSIPFESVDDVVEFILKTFW